MAGKTYSINLGDDELLPAWQTVIDMSSVTATADLTIVGGLMTYLHAGRGGIEMPRSTDDADVLVDYYVNASSLSDLSISLHRIGFVIKADSRYAYRFLHPDGRKVDVMVADHLPSHMRPRISRRPALEAPAGAQAIRRRDTYRLTFRTRPEVLVGVPDEIGALVAKGAAYLIDSRDKGRHLDDAATLLASITDASQLDYGEVSKNDRRRLSLIKQQLSDPSNAHWLNLESDARSRGHMNLSLVSNAMHLP